MVFYFLKSHAWQSGYENETPYQFVVAGGTLMKSGRLLFVEMDNIFRYLLIILKRKMQHIYYHGEKVNKFFLLKKW